MLLVGVALVMAAGVGWLATRQATPTGGSGPSTTTPATTGNVTPVVPAKTPGQGAQPGEVAAAVTGAVLPIIGTVIKVAGAAAGGGGAAAGGAAVAGGAGAAAGGVTAGAATGAGVAATALIAAGAGIGAAITGDAWGAAGGAVGTATQIVGVTSGFSPIIGQAPNLARVGAREIDRALSLDGKPTTSSTAYQVAAFTGALVVGCYGAAWIPFVGQILLLVVAIGVAVSDGERLKYGERGLADDLKIEAGAVFGRAQSAAIAAVCADRGITNGAAGLDTRTLKYINAIAASIAIGWAQAQNDQRERTWRRTKPTPIGHSEASWYNYNKDRGIFCTPAVLQGVVFGWVKGLVDPERGVDGYAFWHSERRKYQPATVTTPGVPPAPAPAGIDPTVKGPELYEAQGWIVANRVQYLQIMTAKEGFGLDSPELYARTWKERGAFLGEVTKSGDLIADGVRIDWQASKNAGQPVMWKV